MTREEAIKLIDTHTVCFYNEIDSPTLQALHMAIEALSADAYFTDGNKIAEWIPVSERLPNEGEVVLVCMRIESHKAKWEEQRSIEFGRINSDMYDYYGTGWEWLNESGADYWQADWNNSILAWMPLPKPYIERRTSNE